MEHGEEYLGHRIAVTTFSVGKGFRWGYTIDGHIYREGEDRLLRDEKAVLGEGVNAAQAHINQIDKAHRPRQARSAVLPW